MNRLNSIIRSAALSSMALTAALAAGSGVAAASPEIGKELVGQVQLLGRLLKELDTTLIPHFAPEEYRKSLADYDAATAAEVNLLRVLGTEKESEVLEKARGARAVLFGDFHGLPEVQKRAIDLLERIYRDRDRPLLFTAEWIHADYQKEVESYMAGHLTTDELRVAVKYDESQFSQAWWPDYAAVLEKLRSLKARVLAAYVGQSWADIAPRDGFVRNLLARELEEQPDAQVFFMHGFSHLLGPGHQGDYFESLFPGETVTFLSVINPVHWQAVAQGIPLGPETVIRLEARRPNTFYVPTAPLGDLDTVAFVNFGYWVGDAGKAAVNERAEAARNRYSTVASQIEKGDWAAAAQSYPELLGAIREWCAKAIEHFPEEEGLDDVKPRIQALEDFARP
jgi:hypothetical protein